MAASLLSRLLPPPRSRTVAKAASGIGATWMMYEPLLSSIVTNPQQFMRDAQSLFRTNLWIRSAEMVIGDRFSTVPWHLEDADENAIDDDAPPQLQAIRNLIERPYTPVKGDPQTATPRTRSALWKITCRHMGLCGLSFWYLDQTEALAGTPLQILYLNPARMTPVEDDSGNLIDWALDADNRGHGTRLGLQNVLRFQLEPPDSGHLGLGLVEAAVNQAELVRLSTRHSSATLQAGGRLAGVLSPKDGAMNGDQFEQLKRDVRTLAEAPDSAKRMLILQGPVEFDRTAATIQELDLVSVVNSLGRDPIMALWGVPLTQRGVALPAGLNSGGAKDVDFEVLWQNAVGPRLRTFSETVQYELLDRYKDAGIQVELEIDEPEFDDRTPLFAQAQIAAGAGIPLTQNQKLALIGEEPFPEGDPRGDEVWLTGGFVKVYPETIPEPTPPALLPFTGEVPEPDMPPEVKAKQDVRERTVSAMKTAIAKVLHIAGVQAAGRAAQQHGHLTRKPSDVAAIFDETSFRESLEKALRPYAQQIAAHKPAKASTVLDRLLRQVGVHVKDITATTRDTLILNIKEGLDKGLSPAQLGDLIEASSAFNELRAETIARTETGTYLNLAATQSYRDAGITHVLVYDGEGDEECAAANGSTWTVDEAEANPLQHPSCTRDFSPIVGKATTEVPDDERMERGLRAIKAFTDAMHVTNEIHIPPTVVNVAPAEVHLHEREQAAPIVHVSTPAVTVNVPEQAAPAITVSVPEAKAALVQDIRIIEMPESRQKVIRDPRTGLIKEIVEE